MFQNMWAGSGADRRRARVGSIRRNRRPTVEGLERRDLLATLYVATSGSDGGSGTTSSPFGSIQAAVSAANTGDEIRVAAGTYTYNPAADHFGPKGQFSYSSVLGATPVVGIVGKRLTLLGGFTTSNWTVADPTNNVTVIDGQGSHRGIFAVGTDPTSLDLEGFTIQNTVAQGLPNRGGPDAVFAFGGAVFADMGGRQGEADPWVFRNDIFNNNKAIASGAISGEGGRAAGGAIELRYVVNSTFDNVVFNGNQALGANGTDAGGGGLGGAIHLDHSALNGSNLTFINNLARSGSAPNGSGVGRATGESADALGGAIAAIASSQVTLTTVTAVGNQAIGGAAATQGGSGFGGAFYAEGPNVTLTVTDAYIQGNVAQGAAGTKGGLAGGGGIETHNAGLVLDRSRVVANTASSGASTNGGTAGSSGGGGLFLSVFGSSATNTITNSVIADNSVIAGAGGGSADGGGGGIWFQGVSADLSHVTVDNNRIDPRQALGQGLLALGGSTVNLANSILSNHVGQNGGALDVIGGSTINLRRILSFNNARLFSAFTQSGVNGADTVLNVSPSAATPNLYVAPGAPSWDYHLNRKVSNPAIDASVNSTATVDLDGNPRVGVPDLGAYEAITPRIEFAGPITVGEGGQAKITIVRRGDLSDAASVILSVVAGGTATAGVDYQALGPNGSVTINFAPGEASKTVILQTLNNPGNTSAKTVALSLQIAPGSESVARLGTAQVTATILSVTAGPVTPAGFAILDAQPIRSSKGIVGVTLQFNAVLNTKQAKSARAYFLHKLFGKRVPHIGRVSYAKGSSTVTLKFSGPLRPGSSAQLIINASKLHDVSGRPLGGNTTFTFTA